MKQLVELQSQIKSLNAANLQVIGVSYDSPEILKRLSEKQKISIPLLSDPKSEVIKKYRLLNEKAKGRQAGIPHPGTIVIDTDGVIQAKLFVGVYKRHTPRQLLEAAKKLK